MFENGKSQAGHVGGQVQAYSYDDPLPPPLTTKNLRSRIQARTESRNASNLRGQARASRTPTEASRNTMQSTSSSSSSNRTQESNLAEAGAGSSRPRQRAKKKRRITARGARALPRSHSASDEDSSAGKDDDELVDLVISDGEDSADIPPSLRVAAVPSALSSRPTTTAGVSVSSPSLRKILHPSNLGHFHFQDSLTSDTTPASGSISVSTPVASTSKPRPRTPEPHAEPLTEYTCPICFFPPTNATLTPCGHICCGACLFTAVKSTLQRGAVVGAEANVARCPVCRADIPGWDGRGAGVIGLKLRAVFTL